MKNTLHFIFTTIVLLGLIAIIKPSSDHNSKAKSKIAQNLDSESYLNAKAERKRAGQAKLDAPEMYGEIQRQLRTPIGKNAPAYRDNYLLDEYRKAKAKMKPSPNRDDLDFISRGPGNIAGRTRAIVYDPRDDTHSIWVAGSASGGIWKTTDAGQTWKNVSSDLPNLSTNTLGLSPNNPDVIYAGTGEHFVSDTDGTGMFKSTDAGESWFQIADPATYPGFKNISRLIVDPNDENVVVALTSNGSWVPVGEEDYGIWKTTDGGDNWTRLYDSEIGRLDDLDFDPLNFNTMYVAVQGFGVIKSTDGGETWTPAKDGLSPSGRVEIAVSPVDTRRIWASAQGAISGTGSDLYLSRDGGESWALMEDINQNVHFLGGQGWYDNIIAAHPYNADEVYVGGVNLFKFAFLGEDLGVSESIDVDQEETVSFMGFIAAAGFTNGILDVAVTQEDAVNVEVRFGQGT